METCKNEKSIDLGDCIIDCQNNQACENTCIDNFKAEYETCPCQVIPTLWPEHCKRFKADCPFGCPCDAFDCEPDKKSVLVLNTNKSSSVPVLIKFDG